MAIVLNGTTQWASLSGAPITTYPFTILGMFNVDDVTHDHYLVSLYKASLDTSLFRVRAAGATGGDPVRISVQEVATSDATSTGTGFTAGTWFKFSYVGTSSTSRSVRINNGDLGTGAVDVTPTGIDSCLLGVTINATVKSGFTFGKLAYIAQYNIALGAADLAAHQANLDPYFIQRAALRSLVRFDDTDSGATDKTGNFTVTLTGSPTWAASPGLITPRRWL